MNSKRGRAILVTVFAFVIYGIACKGDPATNPDGGDGGNPGDADSPGGDSGPVPCVDDACNNGIALINPSGEINSGIDGTEVNDTSVLGWEGVGDARVVKGGIDYGNGAWRLSLADESEMFQMTSHSIEAGASYGIRFDAAPFENLPAQMGVELYVVQDGDRTAVASWTLEFKDISAPGIWHHYHVATKPGALDAHARKTLGIRFIGVPGPATQRFHSVDNIRLDYWPSSAEPGSFSVSWAEEADRTWVGPGFWANRLQDWEVSEGRLNAISAAPRRTVHRVGTSVRGNAGDFSLSIRTGLHLGKLDPTSRTGLLIGAGPNLEWRGAMLVHSALGRDAGIFCGLNADGSATLVDYSKDTTNNGAVLDVGAVPSAGFPDTARVELDGVWIDGRYELKLAIYKGDTDELLSEASTQVSSDRVLGSFGLISQGGEEEARFWFNDFKGSGTKLQDEPDRHLAILSTLHTLSRGTLKMTAQMPPLHISPDTRVALEVYDGTNWEERTTAPIDPQAYTATFKVDGWSDNEDASYRISLPLEDQTGNRQTYTYEGVVHRDPVDKETIVVAGFTCQRINGSRIGGNNLDWSPSATYYPNRQAIRHTAKHRPDLLAFVGDQIYNGHPTSVDEANLNHDYLYKWYMFLLQWRGLTKSIPTITIPDDHDVYQGNLWGEGGIATALASEGGYVEDDKFVKLVELTQTSHLPDPFDPAPVAQGIGTYFTGLVYGRVGIAVLEDRKFKTGPTNPPPQANQVMLGERQQKFLSAWAEDWVGQDIKFAVSQTPFANDYTHSGNNYRYDPKNEDSNGWPPQRRNEAVALLRQGFMFHVAGDQHLATVFQHGIDQPKDAPYSVVVPAAINFFARVWDPGNTSPGQTAMVRPYKGDHRDGFGNHLTMLAVANPAGYYGQTLGIDPAPLHDQAPGYGIVRIDKSTRVVTVESWPLYADPEYPQTGSQYADWPITFSQFDNDGRVPTGFLPVVDTGSEMNPVLVVSQDPSGEILYATRIRSNRFRPPVFENSKSYTINVFYGDNTTPDETRNGQTASELPTHEIVAFDVLSDAAGTTLRWDVTGSSTLAIEPAVGSVDLYTANGVGFFPVSPGADTTYTLTSSDSTGGKLTAEVTVTASSSGMP